MAPGPSRGASLSHHRGHSDAHRHHRSPAILTVGYRNLGAAVNVTVGHPADKAVLLSLAWHACDVCGLTWAGRRALVQSTELGETRVKVALANLAAAGHVIVHRYPRGGRGLTTEYIVLPGVTELSTAPCAKCVANMKGNRSHGDPFPVNRSHGDPFTGKPGGKGVAGESETGRTGHHQQSVTIEQSGSAESSLPLASPSDHPADNPEARKAAEDALETIGRLVASPKS